MFNAVKKSISIIIDNPILTLSFVIYLIFLMLIVPRLFASGSLIISVIVLGCTILFTAAFFAGWLQMVKTAIKNSKKEDKTDQDRVDELVEMRSDFFAAIPVYIIPLLLGIILYIIMFIALVGFNIKFANHFIGKLDFLMEDMSYITQSGEALKKFLLSLPQEKIMIIYGWEFLFEISIGIFNFLLMFWASALYYPNKCSTSPFSALKNSLIVIFKHPVRSIGLYAFILILGLIFKIMSLMFAANVVLYFIFMILGIYYWVFVFVLIFDYYESRFYDHNTERCDLLGKNETID